MRSPMHLGAFRGTRCLASEEVQRAVCLLRAPKPRFQAQKPRFQTAISGPETAIAYRNIWHRNRNFKPRFQAQKPQFQTEISSPKTAISHRDFKPRNRDLSPPYASCARRNSNFRPVSPPRKALRGGILCSFLEPFACCWNRLTISRGGYLGHSKFE